MVSLSHLEWEGEVRHTHTHTVWSDRVWSGAAAHCVISSWEMTLKKSTDPQNSWSQTHTSRCSFILVLVVYECRYTTKNKTLEPCNTGLMRCLQVSELDKRNTNIWVCGYPNLSFGKVATTLLSPTCMDIWKTGGSWTSTESWCSSNPATHYDRN